MCCNKLSGLKIFLCGCTMCLLLWGSLGIYLAIPLITTLKLTKSSDTYILVNKSYTVQQYSDKINYVNPLICGPTNNFIQTFNIMDVKTNITKQLCSANDP